MIHLLGVCYSSIFANAGQAVVERNLIRSLIETGDVAMRIIVHGDLELKNRLLDYYSDLAQKGALEFALNDSINGADLFKNIDGLMIHGSDEMLYKEGVVNSLPTVVHLHSLELTPFCRMINILCWRSWNRLHPACFVSPSASTAKRFMFLAGLSRNLDYSLPPVEIIPHGVAKEDFIQGDRASGRLLLGLPDKAALILSLNRITHQKQDHVQLVFAFAKLRETCCCEKDLYLLLAGGSSAADKEYIEFINKFAVQLGIAERVLIKEHFYDSEKKHILAAADVFVSIPTNPQESFGVALLEALAAGLPVVATDWNGYRDVMPLEYQKWLVPTVASHELARNIEWEGVSHNDLTEAGAALLNVLVETINRFVNGGPEIETLKNAGRHHVKAFMWEHTAKKLVALWRRLINSGKGKAPTITGAIPPLKSLVDALATHYLNENSVLRSTNRYVDGSIESVAARLVLGDDFPKIGLAIESCSGNGISLAGLRGKIKVSVPDCDRLVLFMLRYGFVELRVED